MKIENSIGWCDETINAVTGCDKVSPGCKNCYAAVGTRARVLRGQGIETWGTQGVRHPVNFELVFRRLNTRCVCNSCHETFPFDLLTQGTWSCGACCGTLRRLRLFADSNSDWLDGKWPVDTLARFLDAIRLAPNIDVLLLTKRIENWLERLDAVCDGDFGEASEFACEWLNNRPPPGVWLGVSVEDQPRADERIPVLLQTPAAVRFLSVEPLIERVNIDIYPGAGHGARTVFDLLDWVIVGGESGKGRRDCGLEAINSIHDQCITAGVPVYVKQDCAFKSGQQGRISNHVWARKEFPVVASAARTRPPSPNPLRQGEGLAPGVQARSAVAVRKDQ